MGFVRNAWYALGWSHEIATDTLLARKVLGKPIVAWRKSSGEVVALADMCPHRFAPLSKGEKVGDGVRCIYHGLEFDGAGKCIHNYHGVAPSSAKVQSFPIREEQKLIWIWMGDADRSEEAAIPQISFLTEDGWRIQYGTTNAKAGYELYNDNLLDLTHATFLHGVIGGPEWKPKTRIRELDDGRIHCNYLVEEMGVLGDNEKRVQVEDNLHWTAPSTHVLSIEHTPRSETASPFYVISCHLLTPETERSTHYFWAGAVPAGVPIPDEVLHDTLRTAFEIEDKPMLEAIQANMGEADLWDLDPILLPADSGAVRARRKLKALLEAESQ